MLPSALGIIGLFINLKIALNSTFCSLNGKKDHKTVNNHGLFGKVLLYLQDKYGNAEIVQ